MNLELISVLSGFPMFRKTLSAVDWSVRVRLERNLSFSAAVRTDRGVHFPGTSETSTVAVSSPEGISSVIKSHFLFTSAYSG